MAEGEAGASAGDPNHAGATPPVQSRPKPTSAERDILIRAGNRYLSLPKFSDDRATVLADTARDLGRLGSSWTSEKVRSWIKNRASLLDPAQAGHPVRDGRSDNQLQISQEMVVLMRGVRDGLDDLVREVQAERAERMRLEAAVSAIQKQLTVVESMTDDSSDEPLRPLQELAAAVSAIRQGSAPVQPESRPRVTVGPGDVTEAVMTRFQASVRQEFDSFSRDLLEELAPIRQQLSARVSPQRAAEMVAVTLGRTGQAVRLVDHPAIRSLAQAVAPDFPLPNSPQLRDAIIRLAAAWRRDFKRTNEGGDYVSLMIDGARIASRRWLGVCISTAARFSFWRMLKLPSQTGIVIAGAVAGVIDELAERGFTTVAIVTDNAAN